MSELSELFKQHNQYNKAIYMEHNPRWVHLWNCVKVLSVYEVNLIDLIKKSVVDENFNWTIIWTKKGILSPISSRQVRQL